MRLPYSLRHQLIQGLHQVGYIATPDRLRRPRDLKSLAFEDVFQPIQRQVITIMWCTT
jgi:hypothetical protein